MIPGSPDFAVSSAKREYGASPFDPGPSGSANQDLQTLRKARSGGSAILLIFAAVLIVIHLARPFDVFLVGLHIPLVVCSMALVAVSLTGGLRGFATKTGIAFFAMVSWMILVTPFSYWRGGTVGYIRNYVLLLVVLFLAIAQGPRTFEGVKRLMQVLGITVFAAAVVLHWMASSISSTAALQDYRSGGLGMFGNEGEFALLVGFLLPFWVFMASTVRNRVLSLILMGGGSLYLLRVLVATGTRSALFALVPTFLFLLLRLSTVQRFTLIIVTLIFGVIIVASAPDLILSRLAKVTVADSDDSESVHSQDEAVESARERTELLKDGLETIARNPFFGVGAGNFIDYRYSVLGKERHRTWFPAHNTYLQFAAENGVIGGIIYTMIVISVFLTLREINKRRVPGIPDWDTVDRMTLCLQSALIFFAVMSAFQNCDKYPHLFVLAGFATALDRVTRPLPPETALPTRPVPGTRVPRRVPVFP
jgi:O-antigen ligase